MRILLLEDDPGLSKSLAKGLRDAGYAVDPADRAGEAEELLHLAPRDLIVLDLGLPDEDGLDFLRRIRERGTATPVLILTARGLLEDRVRGLDLGADDYLAKPFALPELLARIRALLRRPQDAKTPILSLADIEIDPTTLSVRRGGEPVGLTVKEFAILRYLAEHADELVTRTMLLDHCWDESYAGLSNLVDVHVSRLRRKLGLDAGIPCLRTVRGAGFILETGVS